MNSKNNLMKIKSALVFLLSSILLCAFFPKGLDEVYISAYIVNAVSVLICETLLINYYSKRGFDLFDQITVISFIYILMFFVTPIYDIITREFLWYEYNLFPYSVKATIIELIGFISFYFAYDLGCRKNKRHLTYHQAKRQNDNYVSIILIMYAFCFFANAYYLIKSGGNSLIYILSLGLIGEGKTENTISAPIGFISMFSYCLPTVTLLYWEYGKSKFLKFALFVPMLMLQVARGFRFFVVQIAITFFAYHYIKNHRRPKIRHIIIFSILLMMPIILMTMYRNTIRAGAGMDLSHISFDTLKSEFDYAIWFNLRIYRNFYAMADKMPSVIPYVGFRQILIGTIVMVIPRVIWPGKIAPGANIPLTQIIGPNLKGTGQAYPNIGEYYSAFGTLGVIFFMALYGWWMKKIKVKYADGAKNGLDIITYAVLLGINLQLIIRGYTPSNFWYMVFSLLPVFVIKTLQKTKKGRIKDE